MIKTPPRIPSKFGLRVNKSTETHPVKVVQVGSAAKFGTVAYEESVRLACLAAKAEEQRILEEQFGKGSSDTQSDFD
jgi:hypothetical protein